MAEEQYIIEIIQDDAQFKRGLKEAERSAKKLADSLGKDFDKVERDLNKAAKAAADLPDGAFKLVRQLEQATGKTKDLEQFLRKSGEQGFADVVASVRRVEASAEQAAREAGDLETALRSAGQVDLAGVVREVKQLDRAVAEVGKLDLEIRESIQGVKRLERVQKDSNADVFRDKLDKLRFEERVRREQIKELQSLEEQAIREIAAKRNASARRAGPLRGAGGLGRASLTTGVVASAGGIAAGAGAAAVAGVSIATVDFLRDSVRAAAEAEAAFQKVVTALEAQGHATSEAVAIARELEQVALDVSATTVFSKDQTQEAEAFLVAMGLAKDEIAEALPLVLDFAQLTDRTVRDAAVGIGKAVKGQTEILQEAGITINKAAVEAGGLKLILDEIAKVAGGQATAATQTLEGRIANLADAYRNVQVEIGRNISGNQELNALVLDITAAFAEQAKSMAEANNATDDLNTAQENFASRTVTALVRQVRDGIDAVDDMRTGFILVTEVMEPLIKKGYEIIYAMQELENQIRQRIPVVSEEFSKTSNESVKKLGELISQIGSASRASLDFSLDVARLPAGLGFVLQVNKALQALGRLRKAVKGAEAEAQANIDQETKRLLGRNPNAVSSRVEQRNLVTGIFGGLVEGDTKFIQETLREVVDESAKSVVPSGGGGGGGGGGRAGKSPQEIAAEQAQKRFDDQQAEAERQRAQAQQLAVAQAAAFSRDANRLLSEASEQLQSAKTRGGIQKQLAEVEKANATALRAANAQLQASLGQASDPASKFQAQDTFNETVRRLKEQQREAELESARTIRRLDQQARTFAQSLFSGFLTGLSGRAVREVELALDEINRAIGRQEQDVRTAGGRVVAAKTEEQIDAALNAAQFGLERVGDLIDEAAKKREFKLKESLKGQPQALAEALIDLEKQTQRQLEELGLRNVQVQDAATEQIRKLWEERSKAAADAAETFLFNVLDGRIKSFGDLTKIILDNVNKQFIASLSHTIGQSSRGGILGQVAGAIFGVPLAGKAPSIAAPVAGDPTFVGPLPQATSRRQASTAARAASGSYSVNVNISGDASDPNAPRLNPADLALIQKKIETGVIKVIDNQRRSETGAIGELQKDIRRVMR